MGLSFLICEMGLTTFLPNALPKPCGISVCNCSLLRLLLNSNLGYV